MMRRELDTMLPTKEQIRNAMISLKARKLELDEEKEEVERQLAEYIGMLRLLLLQEQDAKETQTKKAGLSPEVAGL